MSEIKIESISPLKSFDEWLQDFLIDEKKYSESTIMSHSNLLNKFKIIKIHASSKNYRIQFSNQVEIYINKQWNFEEYLKALDVSNNIRENLRNIKKILENSIAL